MNGWDKYIDCCRKLRRRYSRNGVVTVSHGGILSIYGALDYAAWRKYVLLAEQL